MLTYARKHRVLHIGMWMLADSRRHIPPQWRPPQWGPQNQGKKKNNQSFDWDLRTSWKFGGTASSCIIPRWGWKPSQRNGRAHRSGISQTEAESKIPPQWRSLVTAVTYDTPQAKLILGDTHTNFFSTDRWPQTQDSHSDPLVTSALNLKKKQREFPLQRLTWHIMPHIWI